MAFRTMSGTDYMLSNAIATLRVTECGNLIYGSSL